MNVRDIVGMEGIVPGNRLAAVRQPIGHVPGSWLASPIFKDALCYGEGAFGALPVYAKLVALRRTTIDVPEHAIASRVLDNVCVSFIELSTDFVNKAVDSYLGRRQTEGNPSSGGVPPSSESLVGIPAIDYPLIARPPCLLQTGRHVFLDGWMRFFSYRARGDLTIPLLALDWLDFHDRLGTNRRSNL
jgi:hypothetical protein